MAVWSYNTRVVVFALIGWLVEFGVAMFTIVKVRRSLMGLQELAIDSRSGGTPALRICNYQWHDSALRKQAHLADRNQSCRHFGL